MPKSKSFLPSVPMSRRRRLLHLLLTLTFISISAAATCPLDFSILRPFISTSSRPSLDPASECQYIRKSLRLVLSDHLRRTSSFLPPPNSSDSCWSAYQLSLADFLPNFDIRSSCGFQTTWISQGCMNINTRAQFEALIPKSSLDDVVSSCNQSLQDGSPCASCTTSLSSLQASYLSDQSVSNLTDCGAYPSIYAAAFANQFGPTDKGTANCLFFLEFASKKPRSKKKKSILILIGVGGVLILIITGFWFFCKKRLKSNIRNDRTEMGLGSGLDSLSESTTLIKYTLEDLKKATRNFSRDSLIGRGGYGNVYKGVLPDGSEVALKRFKNSSASGDATFAHEVEVIASVRHVNLVALRGYCTATTPLEGHQRIIVCDLMKNGSLYDHLFGSMDRKLSWPIRQKIALGTARGLAYLHHGAQPGIIHRDIKGSNILLDEMYEPKVADFGLAKFTPEGVTHMSTRVAGTMGYVAPEYALYGQLTERSDVYSFGVVFLELLSGKKALMVNNESQQQPLLVTDWAWSLVRRGRALDVVEDGMPELGTAQVVEKYVLVAVLCSHPQMYARPTMDQVVNMLETDLSVPSIPERPIPLVAEMDDIERSMSSTSSSIQMSCSPGYQPFTFENDHLV